MTGRFLRGHCTHPSECGQDQPEAMRQGCGPALWAREWPFARPEKSWREGAGRACRASAGQHAHHAFKGPAFLFQKGAQLSETGDAGLLLGDIRPVES